MSKKGGRRQASIEDNVEASIPGLEDYIKKCEGILIIATGNNTDDMKISSREITRKQKWEGKQVYGRFKRLISDILHEKMWT